MNLIFLSPKWLVLGPLSAVVKNFIKIRWQLAQPYCSLCRHPIIHNSTWFTNESRSPTQWTWKL